MSNTAGPVRMPRKVIVDVDVGVDDAEAIFLALHNTELVQIVAITTVQGNTSLENVIRNLNLTLQEAGRSDIPVFRGCNTSLMGRPTPDQFFGSDGMGDFLTSEELAERQKTWPAVSEKPAALAIVDLVREHAGDIDLVCLAPLTNIALALRLDPQLASRVRTCYIMGGTSSGLGNITPAAEFNFFCDPEAVHVVLNGFQQKIILMPWEVCLNHSMGWDWYFDDLMRGFRPDTAEGPARAKIRSECCPAVQRQLEWMHRMNKSTMSNYYADGTAACGFILADQLLVALVCRPDLIKSLERNCPVNILLPGSSGGRVLSPERACDYHGVLIVDRRHFGTRPEHWPLISIVNTVHMPELRTFIADSFHRGCSHSTDIKH